VPRKSKLETNRSLQRKRVPRIYGGMKVKVKGGGTGESKEEKRPCWDEIRQNEGGVKKRKGNTLDSPGKTVRRGRRTRYQIVDSKSRKKETLKILLAAVGDNREFSSRPQGSGLEKLIKFTEALRDVG